MLQNHAHGTFTDFRGVGRSLSHGLIFSRVKASTKPGVIHSTRSLRHNADLHTKGIKHTVQRLNRRIALIQLKLSQGTQ